MKANYLWPGRYLMRPTFVSMLMELHNSNLEQASRPNFAVCFRSLGCVAAPSMSMTPKTNHLLTGGASLWARLTRNP